MLPRGLALPNKVPGFGGELVAGLLAWLAPPHCACRELRPLPARRPDGLCLGCRESLEFDEFQARGPKPLIGRFAPYRYEGAFPGIVAAAKFDGRRNSADALGHLLAQSPAARDFAAHSTLVPVPLGKKRRILRGFNQAERIARVCARQWNLKLDEVLQRSRETAAQTELGGDAREANVRGAFRCLRSVSGPVTLIDDVTTSGATLAHAAQALLEAGASEVRGVAVLASLTHAM